MDEKFCKNLKEYRKACGLTQAQTAKPLNVATTCYAGWEQGRTEPDVGMIRAIAKELRITIEELFNGSPSPDPPDDPTDG